MKYRNIYALCLFALALGCSEAIESDPQECFGDAKKCSSDRSELLACINGKWSTVQQCQNGTTCDYASLSCKPAVIDPCANGGCEAKCTEKMLACDPNANQLLVCSGGKYVTSKVCQADEWCSPAQNDCVRRTAEAECEATEFKCENNSLYHCQSGRWSLSKTCAPQTVCNTQSADCDRLPECSGDVKKCDENLSRVFKCDNGFWSVDETCTDGAECDKTSLSCKKGCEENAKRCDVINNVLMKCSGGEWKEDSNCAQADQICNAESLLCEAKPECSGRAIKCSDDSLATMICSDGRYVKKDDCPAGTKCLIDTCVSSCVDGASECRQGNAVTCNQGIETVTACAQNQDCIVRENKASCEEHVCDDGDFECVDKGKKRTCQNNKWVEAACDPNYQCSVENKDCIETICEENAKQCNLNNVETCMNNAWAVSKECKSTEMCANNDCTAIVCSDGDKRCNSSNAVEKCTSNSFSVDSACKTDEICMESGKSANCIKRVCQENDYQCSTSNVLERCVNNAWVTSKTCSQTQICDAANKKCADRACEENAVKCSGSSKSVMICSGNAWKTKDACSSKGELCYVVNGTAQCQPKVCETGTSCESNTIKVCENNQYTYTKPCLSSEICNATNKSCDPRPQCASGEYKCDGMDLYACSTDFRWQKMTTCVGNEVCDKDQKKCVDTSVCSNGQAYCDGKNLMTCDSTGQWKLDKTCRNTENCNASTKGCVLIPVCENGEYDCNGLKLRKCVDGQWTDDKICTAAQTCSKNLKKCLNCTPGEYVCDGQTLKYCNAGDWTTKSTCTATQTCSETEENCLNCTGDGYQCDGLKLQQCSNYNWVTRKTCTSSQYCDASQQKCIDKAVCSGNTYTCDGQKLMKCDGGQWKLDKTCNNDQNCNATGMKCDPKPVCEPGKTTCDGNTLKTCDANGQWADRDCTDAAVCVTQNMTSSCVDKLVLPTWCNIQGIDDNNDQGYGRVLMPNEVQIGEIGAHFVCGSVSDPVMSWTYDADAVYNHGCTNCYANTEFMSYSMNAPAGDYQCTYRFDFGPQSFACVSKTAEHDGAAPILLDSTTRMSADQTLPINISVAPDTVPNWCHFKDFQTASTKIAYGRIALPYNTSPAMVNAKLICGHVDEPVSAWSISRPAKQNLFCDNCGINIEFMSEPFMDDAHPVASGTYGCAFQFDVAGKSFVCPTYNGSDGQTGGELIELSSGKMLNAMGVVNVEGDPISVWSITVE